MSNILEDDFMEDMNDRKFIRQAAIAAMQGMLIPNGENPSWHRRIAEYAMLHAKRLLEEIKKHEAEPK